MKTITRIFAMLAVISAAIFMDACKGEKGDVGPAGTTGTAGIAGPTGANGATGAVGATGTANVQYSDWLKIPITGSSSYYSGNIAAPKITQDIMDKGTVLVFVREFTTAVYQLPFVNASATFNIDYYLKLGFLFIQTNSSGLTNSTNYQFRYVIIPGGVSIGGGRMAALKSMTYEEVKVLFNIPD